MNAPRKAKPIAPQVGPSVWAVSDGRAGNAAQVRAIIQALGSTSRWMKIAHIQGEGHRERPIVLTPRAPWTWLPGARWPMERLALPPEQRTIFQPPWPTLWIGAGRKVAPYSAHIRKASGGERALACPNMCERPSPTRARHRPPRRGRATPTLEPCPAG